MEDANVINLAAAKPCPRPCSVCEGEDHHWMEDFDEDTFEPLWVCKHCDAEKPYE